MIDKNIVINLVVFRELALIDPLLILKTVINPKIEQGEKMISILFFKIVEEENLTKTKEIQDNKLPNNNLSTAIEAMK